MSNRAEKKKDSNAGRNREERLKAALKSNIARRKAQARKRGETPRSDSEQ